MFEQPLSAIRADHDVNEALDHPRLPRGYQRRFGTSISNIAKEASKLGLVAPAPTESDLDTAYSNPYPKSSLVENIYPQLLGNCVEFLAAYKTSGKDKAMELYFPQACGHIDDLYYPDPLNAKDTEGALKGQKNPMNRIIWENLDAERQEIITNDLDRLSELLFAIDADPDSYEGIKAACEFIAFHNSYHDGRRRYPCDGSSGDYKMDVVPSVECARQIYRMVRRVVNALAQCGTVQDYQFEYPFSLLSARNNGVNGGRLDFVANNEILDVKTDAGSTTNANKLQVLLYLALMQRVRTNKPVKKAAIMNIRENILEEHDWEKLTPDFREILLRLIDYTGWDRYDRAPKSSKDAGKVREEVKNLIK